jgi:hypothetical protein
MSISTGEVRGSAADDNSDGSPSRNTGPGRLRPGGYSNQRTTWRGVPGLPNNGHHNKPPVPVRDNVARAALYGSGPELEQAPKLAPVESQPSTAPAGLRSPETDYDAWEDVWDHSRSHGGF